MIYLDNAATTPISIEVAKEMMPWVVGAKWGNPSALYDIGKSAKKEVQHAREQVATLLGCTAKEVYFTSCGSEADNWAIKQGALSRFARGNHIIVSAIEHHAILNSCVDLESKGFEVTYLKPNDLGVITARQVEEAMRPSTIMVSIMMANNEIGTIEPIKEIAEVAHKHKCLMHTDAVQAAGAIPIDVKDLDVDMLSISGHKFHAPKGIGALYVKTGVRVPPFIDGGGQENKMRAGTENVSGIVGIGKAAEIAYKNLTSNYDRLCFMRNNLIIALENRGMVLNGSLAARLPNNINVITGRRDLLESLNKYGVCVSAGSACNSDSIDPSYVLLAIGLTADQALSSIRITLGTDTTDADIERFLKILDSILEN